MDQVSVEEVMNIFEIRVNNGEFPLWRSGNESD